jgi:NADH-quinone oxidoreductase subunit G
MSSVKVEIDGKVCEATEGEYILNVARANDIFIPAICYLTRCSPTLACRICLVEADGKQVYACNAKVKDGMSVVTMTENIIEERKAIMEVYDVNHPLECGVCDKSGECELQNYTLEVGVSEQHYAIKDTHKVPQDWGLIKYDPALCIVCERCVSACKDMIGDAALKTVPRGGDKLAKELKEEMPKDAYAMWNKLQKSLIGPASGGDSLDCTNCGECIEVCPVGALISSDFQYKSNAWELERVPATCAHCSAGCHLYYEKKHTSIANPEERLYRVKNEWNYASLCGAGRFGFDFENKNTDANMAEALKAFKDADTIAFNSYITNEEAMILQKLKEKFSYRLVNKEAKAFQNFLKAYSKSTGDSLYDGTLQSIHDSNFIVSVGSNLTSDNPRVRFALNNALTMNKGAGLYFHPMEDNVIANLSKKTLLVGNHAPLHEEYALYLILDLFGKDLPKEVSEYLASFHSKATKTVEESIKEEVITKVKKSVTDENGVESEVEEEVKKMVPKKVKKEVEYDKNALCELLGLDVENFADDFKKLLAKKDTFALIAGEDLYTHPNSKNIANLLGLIKKHTEFSVTMIPSQTNTLGVSLICDLDEACGSSVIGYNEAGDYTVGSNGQCDFNTPALNQQEGTFTNIDKRVVPTNVALSFDGKTLNDIANALGVVATHTIDYTALLPVKKGYRAVAFDELDNAFSNAGEELRGYLLEMSSAQSSDEAVQKVTVSAPLGQSVLYRCNPVLQFNEATNQAEQLQARGGLYVSETFAKTLALNAGDKVNIKKGDDTIEAEIIIDNRIDGSISYLPTFDSTLDVSKMFDGYRFSEVKIEKVDA